MELCFVRQEGVCKPKDQLDPTGWNDRRRNTGTILEALEVLEYSLGINTILVKPVSSQGSRFNMECDGVTDC
jgi:hypothetical protein